MSLADRIGNVEPNRGNHGCVTCDWVEALAPGDRAAIDEWIEARWSVNQLWEMCRDDPDNPLDISLSGFRHHVRHHRAAP